MDMVWNQHPSPALSKAHNLFLPWNLYLDLGEDNPYILSALEDDNLNGAAMLVKNTADFEVHKLVGVRVVINLNLIFVLKRKIMD